MSKLSGKKVNYVRAHGPIFIPDIGQVGPELVINNKITDMQVDEPFLVLTMLDKVNKPQTVGIPLANLSHMRQVPNQTDSK